MRTWGIVPAAGAGSRIQPLAFSKELLPVGSRSVDGIERPRAVSEYLVERMVRGGATNVCFVVSPGKTDILAYFGAGLLEAHLCYTVQPQPAGLCDALFHAAALVAPEDQVLVGLPDTVWFPEDGFARLPHDALGFLLFPVEHSELFDAVVIDAEGGVLGIDVKQPAPRSSWIWGAFRMPGSVYHALHALWQARHGEDEYFGTLVNAYVAQGGRASGVRAGEIYVDVGTLHGYREAIGLLSEEAMREGLTAGGARVALGWPEGRMGGHQPVHAPMAD